jgi:hypothetical protein
MLDDSTPVFLYDNLLDELQILIRKFARKPLLRKEILKEIENILLILDKKISGENAGE